MKKLLLAYGRRMLCSLAACTLIASTGLCFLGRGKLIGALFIGYVAAAACWCGLAQRIWRMADMGLHQAKMQMWIGMGVGMGTVFIVFWAAIQISFTVFLAVVGGFFFFSLLTMYHLAVLNYEHADKKNSMLRR
jgi:hypothetical protein